MRCRLINSIEKLARNTINNSLIKITLSLLTFALMSSTSYAADDLDVYYRTLAKNAESEVIHGEIVIKNRTGKSIPLENIEALYHYTQDATQDIVGEVSYAAMIGEEYSELKEFAKIAIQHETINLGFTSTDEVLPARALIIFQFRITSGNGALFNQENDPSFNAGAEFLSLTDTIAVNIVARLKIVGVVVDGMDGSPVANARITANETVVHTDSAGAFSLSVIETEEVIFEVFKEGFANYYQKFNKNELKLDNFALTSSPHASPHVDNTRSRVVNLLRWHAEKTFTAREGGKISTADGTSITFPATANLNINFNVGLTSMFSPNTNQLKNLGLYMGRGESAGLTPLKIFSVIDVVVIDAITGKEINLNGYEGIKVSVITDCANSRNTPVPTWYLDEKTGNWVETGKFARFKPHNGQACHYEYTVNHFTKYAVAKKVPGITTLEIDLTGVAADPAAQNQIHLLEISNESGILFRNYYSDSEMTVISLDEIPTYTNVYVKLTNLSTGKTSNLALDSMEDYTSIVRHVVMPTETAPVRQTEIHSSASPVIQSSGNHSTEYAAWKAFDASLGSMWISGIGQTPAWISYAWTTPRVITHYSLKFSNGNSLATRAPKDFRLEGWNGESWQSVDEQSNQVQWNGGKTRNYSISSPGSYTNYRLFILDDNDNRSGIVVISLGDIAFYGYEP